MKTSFFSGSVYALVAGMFFGLIFLIATSPKAPAITEALLPSEYEATIIIQDVPGARCYIMTRLEWVEADKHRWSIDKHLSCIPRTEATP